ncbi:hypothetical protein HPP92_003945 [Vanilla planifolia]|uniref:Uncharacterized protein n=1 Tax=Vanilla planifolia TaxID=51239 RepID=A0A835VFZ5_VANPL|nr:hypothetical protein HPP92_003945 [Vanilla planifolia]
MSGRRSGPRGGWGKAKGMGREKEAMGPHRAKFGNCFAFLSIGFLSLKCFPFYWVFVLEEEMNSFVLNFS